jgi:SAM-dependent methyltransferase
MRTVVAHVRKYYKKLQAIVRYRALTVEQLLKRKHICLYAGDLPGMKGYEKFTGLSLTQNNRWHLRHDVTQKYPLPDDCVEMYQSEDVFEHIPYEQLPAAITEIYRILKPGGLFRLVVPDYRCDVLVERSVKDAEGRILFDPRGGGRFVGGKVVDRGHVWFPVYETVRDLLARTPFKNVDFRHYYDENGQPVTKPIDYTKSHVKRTPDHDPRVQNPYRPLSIVVDCYK